MDGSFFQSAGEGENVICLHSSMNLSAQWNALVEKLRHSHRTTMKQALAA